LPNPRTADKTFRSRSREIGLLEINIVRYFIGGILMAHMRYCLLSRCDTVCPYPKLSSGACSIFGVSTSLA
jgi:hypothetical protein